MTNLRWLDALERRFGSWTVHEFPLFIVMANGLVYLLSFKQPALVSKLILIPGAVWEGEWWRVLTFLFVPPTMGPIGMALWLYFLYQMANTLENEWGEFRFCFFYFIGALATVIASLFIARQSLSNVPLNTTLFLAFAALYPEMEILLFFILPIRVKYLAWLTWAWISWSFITGGTVSRIAIGASLFNYFLFFGQDLWQGVKLKIHVYRNRNRFRN